MQLFPYYLKGISEYIYLNTENKKWRISVTVRINNEIKNGDWIEDRWMQNGKANS